MPRVPGGPVTEIPRTQFQIAVFGNRFPALSPGSACAVDEPGEPYRRERQRADWQQDQFYWPLDSDNMNTMWMPLVDVHAEVAS